MNKPRVKLENFIITDEYGYFHLEGDAIDHPRLKTLYVSTSKLLNIDFVKMEAETLNTIYLLEE
jgi:hypothetical protein